MFYFIVTLLVIALIPFLISFKAPTNYDEQRNYNDVVVRKGTNLKRVFRFVAAGFLALALIFTVFASFYTQDPGEAVVQKSVTGELVGQTTNPGMHLKAPWVKTVSFDIRNNVISYVGDGSKGDHSGGSSTGAQITFQDREGVTGNLDIVVRYSINPDAVTDIYAGYQTQGNFVNRVITNDIRSVVRNIPSKYTTIEVYNGREAIGSEILAGLEARWANDGIVVEEVSLQEIRYSDDVKARFDEAQAARIAVTKATAEQETARVNAETEVIKQQGVADANAILTESLTPAVLQQRYIDALKAGTVFVVPSDSSPLINVPGSPTP